MRPWKFPSDYGNNASKMSNMRRHFPETRPQIHWQYLVLLHRCNFEGRLDKEDTQTLLDMLQGPMYDEAAFVEMETPLLNTLVTLRSELQITNPKRYYQHDKAWWQIADQMQRVRDSSHRALNPDEGRANEYLVFFRSQ